jgi:ATP-dependent Lhr-like helicase
MLLARYGILFRDLLARESTAPRWRELLGILRRLEARGELRGGRFVSGFSGEQFALPEAADSLRASRSRDSDALISVAAADPLNLIGAIIPGERVPAIPGRFVRYRNGAQAIEDQPAEDPRNGRQPAARAAKARRRTPAIPAMTPASPPPPARRLF